MSTAKSEVERVESRLAVLLEHHVDADPPGFLRAQYDLGLAWVHFAEGFGGLGVEAKHQQIVERAITARRAPRAMVANPIGVGFVGPTLHAHGTDAQKLCHLPTMFTGEEIWCQLFSEPNAGSDLASLATRAEPDGDGWRITGQKVWTSLAHLSSWGLLVARTDPEAPKHAGMTCFIIDMTAPGVEVRALRQMTGDAEFNEVFLDGVEVPDDRRVGDVGAGWPVATSTLSNERSNMGAPRSKPRSGAIGAALKVWESTPSKPPALREELVRAWVEAEVARLTALRAQALRARGTPGPAGAIGKLAYTKVNQDVTALTIKLLGAEGMLYDDYSMTRPEVLGVMHRASPQRAFLRSRANSIESGTSEIVRTLIAERMLGLPREPRPEDPGVR